MDSGPDATTSGPHDSASVRPAAPGPASYAIVLVLALALAAITAVRGGIDLDHSEAFAHAQIARNLARGEGLSTQQTLPYEYRLFDGVPHPSLYHPPLPAIALAPWFLAFGPREDLAIVPGVIAYALTAVAAFATASAHAGAAAGWLATLLFLTHGASLGFATSGIAQPIAAAGLSASVLVLTALPAATRPAAWLGAGAALGIATLGLGALRGVLPVVALWALLQGGRASLGRLLFAAGGFVLAVLPECSRMARATGSPFGGYERYLLMADIPPFFELNWFRTLTPVDPIATLSSAPYELQSKLVLHARQLRALSPLVLSPVLMACVAAACPAWSPPGLRLAARVVALLLAAQLVLHTVLRVSLPELATFAAPAAAVTAAALVAFARARRRIGTVTLAAVAAALLWLQFPAWREQFRANPEGRARIAAERALAARLGERAGRADLVVSDASEMLAWRADLRTVWLPLTPGLLDRIPQRPGERRFLLLTRAGAPDTTSIWGRYLPEPEAPPGYSRLETWRQGPLEAALFQLREPEAAAGPEADAAPAAGGRP